MPKTGVKEKQVEKIIIATLVCATQDSLEKITLESIARQAEVSKGIISYYFESKQDLLLNAFRFLLDSYSQALQDAYQQAPSMKELLYSMSDMLLNETAPAILQGLPQDAFRKLCIQFYRMISTNEHFRMMAGAVYQEYLQMVRDVIREGINRKEFRDIPDELVSYSILAQLDGLMLYAMMGFSPSGMSVSQASRRLIDLLVSDE